MEALIGQCGQLLHELWSKYQVLGSLEIQNAEKRKKTNGKSQSLANDEGAKQVYIFIRHRRQCVDMIFELVSRFGYR